MDYNLNLKDAFGLFNHLTVTAAAFCPESEIKVNGVKMSSGAVSDDLRKEITKPGDAITIEVRQDGFTRIYTITATDKSPMIVPERVYSGSVFMPVENIINNSGMSGTDSLNDTHDNHHHSLTSWHSHGNPGKNAWVTVDLGNAYCLDEMWIWNHNQLNLTDRGLKNVKIEYSIDNKNWVELAPQTEMSGTTAEYPFQFARASGAGNINATNLNNTANSPVRFSGVHARYVKITADPQKGEGNWGSDYYGLSELRFTWLILPPANYTVNGMKCLFGEWDHPALRAPLQRRGINSPPLEGGHFAQQNGGVVPKCQLNGVWLYKQQFVPVSSIVTSNR